MGKEGCNKQVSKLLFLFMISLVPQEDISTVSSVGDRTHWVRINGFWMRMGIAEIATAPSGVAEQGMEEITITDQSTRGKG